MGGRWEFVSVFLEGPYGMFCGSCDSSFISKAETQLDLDNHFAVRKTKAIIGKKLSSANTESQRMPRK